MILIDGVPQENSVRASGRGSHSIDFSLVERIEVINGASASNGASATGGTINIITKQNKDENLKQSINLNLSSPTNSNKTDSTSYKIAYNLNGMNGNFDYLFGLSYEDSGIWRDAKGSTIGVSRVQGDLANSKSLSLLSKIGYYIGDTQYLSLSANHYKLNSKNNYNEKIGNKKNKIFTTATKGKTLGIAPSNENYGINLKYENDDLLGANFETLLFYQNLEHIFGVQSSKTFFDPKIPNSVNDQSRIKSNKVGLKSNLNKGFFDNKLALTLGFDALQDKTLQDLLLTNRIWMPKIKYTSYAPFIMTNYKINEMFSVNAGLRYETIGLEVPSFTSLARFKNTKVETGKLDFSQTLKNIGFVYNINKDFRLFTNYSEGYSIPDVGGTVRSINDPKITLSKLSSIKPVLTNNYEIGLAGDINKASFEILAYQSSSKLGATLEVNKETGLYQVKKSKTLIKGFEVNGAYQILDNHKITLAYSNINGKLDSDNNGSLDRKMNAISIPPNKLNLSLSSNWGILSSYIGLNYLFDKSYEEENSNFKAYGLVDLGLFYNSKYGNFSLNIANLFNKQYATFYAQSQTLSPTTVDIDYIAGRGRVINLGYEVKF